MRRRRNPIRQINLRITEQLRQQLEAVATERRISTNQLMRQLLEDGLNKARQSASIEDRVCHIEDRVCHLESLVQCPA